MSALGLDDVNDPRGVLAYAPRKPRLADDEGTIRPVLERLRRSEGRVPGPRLVRKADVQDMAQPPVETVARSAFPMTARLAVAAGVLALVGAAAAGYLVPPSAADHAAPALAAVPATLPKPVQTVSIQRPADAQPVARIVKDDARMPQPVSARGPKASASVEESLPAPMRQTADDPSTAPLKSWVAVPVAPAPGWAATAQAAAGEAQPAAEPPTQAAPAAAPKASETVHKAAPVHHARHVVHHRAARHRGHRIAQAAPRQGNQSAQPAESQPAQAQAVKKLPLQAAIDRMFGNSGATAAPAPQQ